MPTLLTNKTKEMRSSIIKCSLPTHFLPLPSDLLSQYGEIGLIEQFKEVTNDGKT